MKNRIAGIGLILLILNSFNVIGQATALHWKASTDTMLIGQVLPVTIELTKTDSFSPNWSALLENLSPWEIMSRDTLPFQPMPGNSYTHTLIVGLTTFDSGTYRLGPLVLPRGIDTLYSNILNVNVYDVPVDTAGDIRPIVPPMKAPLTWQEWAIRIGAGLAILLLLYLLWFWWKKWRKKKKAKTLPVLDKPVKEWALQELRKLEAMLPVSQAKDIKYYYDHLAYVIRVFIHYQYGITALELTSAEIEQRIQGIPGYEKWSPEIMPVIHVADLAKFAKATPESDHQQSAMMLVKKWIENANDKPIQPS